MINKTDLAKPDEKDLGLYISWLIIFSLNPLSSPKPHYPWYISWLIIFSHFTKKKKDLGLDLIAKPLCLELIRFFL